MGEYVIFEGAPLIDDKTVGYIKDNKAFNIFVALHHQYDIIRNPSKSTSNNSSVFIVNQKESIKAGS